MPERLLVFGYFAKIAYLKAFSMMTMEIHMTIMTPNTPAMPFAMIGSVGTIA